jgi:tRNA(adenine34) deaminase
VDIQEKMRLTITVAQQALEQGELPIAAVVFLEDEMVSSCYTTDRADKRFLVHAELKALLEADMMKYPVKKRKAMQLFTTLEPCMMCLGAAMSSFIGEIYYALEAPMDGAVSFANLFSKKECNEIPSYRLPRIQGGLMRDDVKNLFKEYVERNQPGAFYDFAASLAGLE